MNDKELCRAWRGMDGYCHYVDARGVHHWSGAIFGPTILVPVAKRDGYEIRWPDGPGVAELVEIVDLWAQTRAALAEWAGPQPEPDAWPSNGDRTFYHAVCALLDAHDRGELP